MTTVIGLAVAIDELRAVSVKNGVVLWATRTERTPEPSLAEQIGTFLASAPVARWQRPRVVAVVGPASAQVKCISGLPPLDNRIALGALVREGAARFFLRNGVPLEVTGVRIAGPDSVWAAAFELPVVAGITQGCRTAGFTLRAILPAVDALGAGLAEGRTIWRDGDVHAEVMLRSGALQAVRRLHANEGSVAEPPPQAVAALRSLGEEGWRFADAYGAALAPASAPLALRAGVYSDSAVSRRRLIVASTTCAIAAFLALTIPPLSYMLDASRARHQLAAIAQRARDAAVVEQDLRRMNSALAQVAAFSSNRRTATSFIASLARSLPQDATLITLRTDTLGGTIVLLAPRAARAIAAFDSLPGVAAPEIVGPVTKEIAGTREVERATVRFHFAGGVPR